MNAARRLAAGHGHDRGPRARVRPVRGTHWLALVLALAMARPQPALADPTEQEVKAALVLNIAHFVQWPATAFGTPSAPLVVTILGRDELSDVLEPLLRGKSVDGHPFELRRVRNVEDVRNCHMLYVAGSEKRRVDAILKALRGSSILTVSDLEHFAERGGHINLLLVDQRVHIIVNLTSAEDFHLKISAKLLSLARIVGTAP